MPAVSFAFTPFRTRRPLPVGCWPLPAGRAISLYPDQPGWVHVVQGRVWVTLDGPHTGPDADLFLNAGDHLFVHGGQRAVIEPFGGAGLVAPAGFDWKPAGGHALSPWTLAVAEPFADLRRALAGAAIGLRAATQALHRLMAAVARLALARPLCRPRVVVRGCWPPAEDSAGPAPQIQRDGALLPDKQAFAC